MKPLNHEYYTKQSCYKNGWPVSVVVGAISRNMACHIEYMMDVCAHTVDSEYYYKFVSECEGLRPWT
jgi:uncharacterized protein YutE (UPF0331/DUF86 family)